MALEYILLLLALGSGAFFIGIPTFKIINALIPRSKKSALAEAKERLEQARSDAAAAKLNKQTERLYNEMYEEALHDDETVEQQHTQEKHK
jgi:hypothetical protein